MSSTFPTKNEPSYEKRASQFVRRLRYLRDKQGVTQADVSSVLGVTKSTISLWENGDTIPDAKSIAALADYYTRQGIDPTPIVGVIEEHCETCCEE